MSAYGSLVRGAWQRHALFTALLELTYRCNLDCVFCYNDLAAPGVPLGRQRYLDLLDELAELQVLHLVLSGGEPLVHPDFFALGGRARELGFAVRVKSNGHALRGALARRLVDEVDPLVVDLSLHGASAATHDRQTRVAGSFARLLANLPALLALGLRLQLNATLTRWNEDEVEGMYTLADRLGVPLTVNPVVSPRDDGDRSPLALTASAEGRQRFLALAERRFLARAARRDASAPDGDDGSACADPASGRSPGTAGYHCGAGTGAITVDPYGNVLPCMQWRRPLGNLHAQRLAEIWRSPALAEVRRINAAAGELATAAAAAGAPASRCMGLAELLTGDPLGDAAAATAAPPAAAGRSRLRIVG